MKRYRVHPLVAITCIICISALAIAAEAFHTSNYEWLKVVAAGAICWILGIKFRPPFLT